MEDLPLFLEDPNQDPSPNQDSMITNENNTASSVNYSDTNGDLAFNEITIFSLLNSINSLQNSINEYQTSQYYNNGPNNSSEVISQAQNVQDCSNNSFYFEEQEQRLCAKHAINNAFQCQLVSPEYLHTCAFELWLNDGINHVEYGEFDDQVIEYALKKLGHDIFRVSNENFDAFLMNSNPLIAIITRHIGGQGHHYSARRFYTGGPLWKFDSLVGKEVIDEDLFKNLKPQFLSLNTNDRLIDAPQINIMAVIINNESHNLNSVDSNLIASKYLHDALSKTKVQDFSAPFNHNFLDEETRAIIKWAIEFKESTPFSETSENNSKEFIHQLVPVSTYIQYPVEVSTDKSVNATNLSEKTENIPTFITNPLISSTLDIQYPVEVSQPKRKCDRVYQKHKHERLDLNDKIDKARDDDKKLIVFKTKSSLAIVSKNSEEYQKYLGLWVLKKWKKKLKKLKKTSNVSSTNNESPVELENGECQRKVNVALATGKKLRLFPRSIEYVGSDGYKEKNKKEKIAVKKFRTK